jgi:G3E family GTPase
MAHQLNEYPVASSTLNRSHPSRSRRSFQAWLTETLETQGKRLYRMKGFVHLLDVDARIVMQGVHMVTDMREQAHANRIHWPRIGPRSDYANI